LHRRLTRGRPDDDHPAVWIEITRHCSHHVHQFNGSREELIRAIRMSRKTLAQKEVSTTAALQQLHGLLTHREE
jgi:hypothetical protein